MILITKILDGGMDLVTWEPEPPQILLSYNGTTKLMQVTRDQLSLIAGLIVSDKKAVEITQTASSTEGSEEDIYADDDTGVGAL